MPLRGGAPARLLLGLVLGQAVSLEEEQAPPGPLFRADQCNISRVQGVPVPDPCAKPDCVLSAEGGRQRVHRRLRHAKHELMSFARGLVDTHGYAAIESAFYMHLLSMLQNNAGVSGGIGRIGAAVPEPFVAMALTRRVGEPLLLADMPRGPRGPGGAAGLPGGRRRLRWANITVAGVAVRRAPPGALSDVDLLQVTGGIGFRLLHVEGGHLARHAYHDIMVAACALVAGGIVMVDDLFRADSMGAAEGFHRFMHGQRRILASGVLVPFLCVGRQLYIAHKRYAEAYRKTLRSSFRAETFVTKELYGSEVLLLTSKAVYIYGFSDYVDSEEAFFGASTHEVVRSVL